MKNPILNNINTIDFNKVKVHDTNTTASTKKASKKAGKPTESTAKKAVKAAPKGNKKKASKKEPRMTYGQVKALAGCFFKAQFSNRKISELIEKTPSKKGMDEGRKAQWLKEHGDEVASYRACMKLAMCYFERKASKSEIDAVIATFDKANKYQPKARA